MVDNVQELFQKGATRGSDPESLFGKVKKFVADILKAAEDAGHQKIPVGGVVRVIVKTHPEWLKDIEKEDRYRRVYNYVRNSRPKGWVIAKVNEASMFVPVEGVKEEGKK